MIGSITFGPIPDRKAGLFQPQDWTPLTPPKPAHPRPPSVAALMKARMLALIQDEWDRQPSSPSVEDGHDPTTAWNVLCRLREAVERMEIPS